MCEERAANSPCQKGIRAGAPGAGVTITRSCSVAFTRQVEEPIRSVGVHEFTVHLHPEVNATVSVEIQPT